MRPATASGSRSWGTTGRTCKHQRDAYIHRLNGIYAANLAKRHVELVRARAQFRRCPHRHCRRAHPELRPTCSSPPAGGRSLPPIPGAALGITSDGFFALPERPARVAVVGSSYIAIELAGIFAGLESQTTLILRTDAALRSFDPMLGEATLKALRARRGGDRHLRRAAAPGARGGRRARARHHGRAAARPVRCAACGPSVACRRSRTCTSSAPGWCSTRTATCAPIRSR